MSRRPFGTEDEPRRHMAVSYSGPLSHHERTPTLPPIRELLPDHLYGRPDPGSHRSVYHAPSISQEWASRQRLASREGPYPGSSSSHFRRSGDTSPRSLPQDPYGRIMTPRRPGRDSELSSPTTHYASPISSPRESKQTLPPLRDLHARQDPFSEQLLAYEPKGRSDSHHSIRQPLHIPQSSPTSVPPSYERTGLYPATGTSPQYSSYQQTYGAPESDYRLINPNSPSGIGPMSDTGDQRHKKRRGNLPKPVTDILRTWFHEHLDHPYPSEEDKQMFMSRTGLSISQISNWFINARRRQLPALRNARAGPGKNVRLGSPLSDGEQASDIQPDNLPPDYY